MKTQSSPESGYFNPRVFVAFLLWVCGAWLAAISFATPASAWNQKYWGTPGTVTFNNLQEAPRIAMGQESDTHNNFYLVGNPTVTTSTAGTYWQYVAVQIYPYYSCAGQWCSGPPFNYATQTSPWMRRGEQATIQYPFTRVDNNGFYWTMLVQVTWYDANRQAFARKIFYPDRAGTSYFHYVYNPATRRYEAQWWGNADMAINTFASRRGYGYPYGLAPGANLNTPTGYIYCLRATRGSL
jgi:hypothetical protein